MMQSESAESLIRRICRALSMADGFALYFVLVNLPTARKLLSLQVQEQLARPVIELHVPPEGFGDTTLDGWLLTQVQDAPAESAVFLHGLEHVLPTGQAALRRVLQQLNWRRSALKQIARPLVLWLPRHALDSMAEHAPDLYDWYSNVYEFASPKEEAEQLRGDFLTEFNTNVHPAQRLSKAEKEQWLHTLAALLDEHPHRNAYRAKLLNDAGGLHHVSGNMEDALELYRQSSTITQEIGNKEGEAATLNNISQIYHAQGDYDTALNYLEQSLAIRQEIADRAGEGMALNNISQIYKERGDYASALKYLEQSLRIRQDIGDKAGEGTTLHNIAGIHWAQGDYVTALPILEQSLVIRQELGDRAGEGTTLNNIGQIYHAQGGYTKAMPLFEQALAISREVGDKRVEGVTLNNISQVYDARGDYAAAFTYLEQSLSIRREIGDKAGEAVTSWNIGRTHEKQGDIAKAEQHISRAVQLAEELGHPKLEEWRTALEEVRTELRGAGRISGS
ncbi:tetratricopeptide repeat protein [Candidatus Electronema sp. JM]|uniref:tetratricopeptide repeat protein n=1 Tax=Candidatus Electronema sp. JM TaxID=3401571 RepID=UPI003AA85053